jgi:hypothetical protein
MGLALEPHLFLALGALVIKCLDEIYPSLTPSATRHPLRSSDVRALETIVGAAQAFYRKDPAPSQAPSDLTSPEPAVGPDSSARRAAKVEEPAQDRRVFLLTLLKRHLVWRDLLVWEEAFLSSFQSKLQAHRESLGSEAALNAGRLAAKAAAEQRAGGAPPISLR